MVHELANKRRISVSGTSKPVANILYSYRGMGLSVGTTIAGWDEMGPGLYYVDYAVGRLKGIRFSVGSSMLMVDIDIVVVGMRGKNDRTNVIKEPVVCGITSLGMDHTEILGDAIEEIAMHKAGVFKPKIPAFTVPQCIEAMDVLEGRACELMELIR